MFRLDEKTAAVEVLQVALPLRLFERVPKVHLDLRDLLEVVWHLEALHVLHDPRKLVVLIEVDQLFLRGVRRRSMRRDAFAAEGQVCQI